jgi:hypothetical protein
VQQAQFRCLFLGPGLLLKLAFRERMRGQRKVVAASREALLEVLPLPRAVGGGFDEHRRSRPPVCGHEGLGVLGVADELAEDLKPRHACRRRPLRAVLCVPRIRPPHVVDVEPVGAQSGLETVLVLAASVGESRGAVEPRGREPVVLVAAEFVHGQIEPQGRVFYVRDGYVERGVEEGDEVVRDEHLAFRAGEVARDPGPCERRVGDEGLRGELLHRPVPDGHADDALLDLQTVHRLAFRLGDAVPERRVLEDVSGGAVVSHELADAAVENVRVADEVAPLELDAADVEPAVVRGVAREVGVQLEVGCRPGRCVEDLEDRVELFELGRDGVLCFEDGVQEVCVVADDGGLGCAHAVCVCVHYSVHSETSGAGCVLITDYHYGKGTLKQRSGA